MKKKNNNKKIRKNMKTKITIKLKITNGKHLNKLQIPSVTQGYLV